jgi:hypothetical protein
MQYRPVTGWQRRLTGIVVAATLAIAIAAPAAAAVNTTVLSRRTSDRSFVGTLNGTDAYVGVVVGSKDAIAYACDGKGLTHWFHPTLKDGVLAGVSPGGAVLTATRKGSTLTGELVLPSGEAHRFSAKRAKDGAGLYRLIQAASGATYTAGWVKLADGSVRGDVTTTSGRGFSATLPPVTTPPTTTPPTTTPPTTAGPPTTAAQRTLSLSGSTVGVPAPPDVKALFPSGPPPDSQVLSATAPTGEATPGGGTPPTTSAGSGAPPTTVAPLGFSDSDCQAINGTLHVLENEIEAISRKKKPTKEDLALRDSLNSVFNEMQKEAGQGGCQNLFGQE